MKTVGDFNKMGGEIVVGDEFLTTETKEVAPITEMLVERINNCRYPDLEIVSFAWRANTGEKPSFEGLIETEERSGHLDGGCVDDYIWEVRNLDTDLTRWRPSLNQGEQVESSLMYEDSPKGKLSNIGNVLHNLSCSMTDEREQSEFSEYASTCWDISKVLSNSTTGGAREKPTYTQAMHDAGEFPPVGSRALIMWENDTVKEFVECKIVFIIDGVGVVICEGEHYSFDASAESSNKATFKPIQTEREKAIDKAKLVIREWVKDDGDSIVNLANMLSDAECLKC